MSARHSSFFKKNGDPRDLDLHIHNQYIYNLIKTERVEEVLVGLGSPAQA
jgi:hypothetical protein